MRYKAVLFDLDYTLGDATQAIYAGFCAASEGMGLPKPGLEEVRRTIGMKAVDAYTLLTGDAGEEGREQFYSLFHPVARDLQAAGAVELFPGAVELLQALGEAGALTAIVSNKHGGTVRAIAERKGLDRLLSCIVGGGMVAQDKPHPAGLRLAMDQLGVAPEEALYCGDTVIDAQTAQNAGVDFCAVLNGTTPAQAFEPFPAVHVAPDLWELRAWLGV